MQETLSLQCQGYATPHYPKAVVFVVDLYADQYYRQEPLLATIKIQENSVLTYVFVTTSRSVLFDTN